MVTRLEVSIVCALAVALLAGCANTGSPGGGGVPLGPGAGLDAGGVDDGAGGANDGAGGQTGADGAAIADGGGITDGVPGGGDTVVDGAGGGSADGAGGGSTDGATNDAAAAGDGQGGADQTFPDGFFDDPDTTTGSDGAAGSDTEDAGFTPTGPVGKLYAQTKKALYVLDLDQKAFAKVGDFSFDKKPGDVTDIALDRYGKLYAVTFDDLFLCVADDASCTFLASLPATFYGLSFVPEGILDPTKEALVGMTNGGDWYHLVIDGQQVTAKKLGSYGDGWIASGDAFSVVGIGTYATLKGKPGTDRLAAIDPATGQITKLIGETGVSGLFGLGWWKGVFYGTSKDGNIYELSLQTGKATKVQGIAVPAGVSWWGAGVSTRAAGPQ